MKMLLSIIFILFLAIYIASHFFTIPDIAIEIRSFIEHSFLYVYFISLAIISLSNLIIAVRNKRIAKNASDKTAILLWANNYITRIIVLGILVVFPLLIYFNYIYYWGLSDAVIVSIPTVMLAMLIAEQNLYSFVSSRSDLTNYELSALASVRQVIDSIYNDPEYKNKIPDEKIIFMLERALTRLEERTKEPNFAKFSTQAILTLNSIKKNNALEIWHKFINRLRDDLKE